MLFFSSSAEPQPQILPVLGISSCLCPSPGRAGGTAAGAEFGVGGVAEFGVAEFGVAEFGVEG